MKQNSINIISSVLGTLLIILGTVSCPETFFENNFAFNFICSLIVFLTGAWLIVSSIENRSKV